MYGYIHSIETMGAVDGPGLRYVIFTSGCPLRCMYCHNPDTWNKLDGKKMTSDELLKDFQNYRSFLKNGGITVSGGEPLLQIDFLIDLFSKAKKLNIHTCLDTSGSSFDVNDKTRLEKFRQLTQVTDLVLLDIKHIDPLEYNKLTKGSLEQTLNFLDFLSKDGTYCDVWIRHVVVKNITYIGKYLYRLGYHVGNYNNIKALEVLPYHDMAVNKYKELNIEYPLGSLPAMTKEQAQKARKYIEAGIIDRRNNNKPAF